MTAVRGLCAAVLLASLAPAGALAASVEDAFPQRGPEAFQVSASEVVERAFDNFYGCDLRTQIDLFVRQDGRQIHHYSTRMARKRQGDLAYQVIQFTSGHQFRRVRALRIHRRDRSDDFFVFTPELRRVRRLSVAQRADRLLGLNMTLEDIEMLFPDEFEILGRSFGSVEGEPVHVVTLGPLFDSPYDRADFFVSQRDYAILEIRYYRPGATEPFKVATSPRAEMETDGGHTLPRRVYFVNRLDGTETEVVYHRRDVNPELPPGLFTKSNLEGELRTLRLEGVSGKVGPAEAR